MKIFEIIPKLSSGGAERFVVDLSNELSNKGNEVTLIVLHGEDKNDFYVNDLSQNVKILYLNKKPGLDISLYNKICEIVQKEKPDIIHTHLRSIVYCLKAAFKYRNVKWFHTIHNDAKKEASDFLSRLTRKILFRKRLVHPVTISIESQKSFLNYYSLESTLIENGRPDGKFDIKKASEILEAKQSGKVVLVNVARMTPQKNQLILTEVIEELNHEGYNLDLFIIGDNETAIGEEIKKKNIPSVHLLGTRSNPRDYMAASDAFILPSVYEGMPITLIECFSTGTVPICTPVGGVKNMIQNGINGILTKDTDKKNIKASIKFFLNLPKEKIQNLESASRKTFSNYGMDKCVDSYLRIFSKEVSK